MSSCWSCTWNRSTRRRARYGWTWMRPMTRYTVTRRADSFTVTTAAIATCRYTSSAGSTCCVRDCANRIAMPQWAASRSSSASWVSCVDTGPTRESTSGEIRDSAGNPSCAGARRTGCGRADPPRAPGPSRRDPPTDGWRARSQPSPPRQSRNVSASHCSSSTEMGPTRLRPPPSSAGRGKENAEAATGDLGDPGLPPGLVGRHPLPHHLHDIAVLDVDLVHHGCHFVVGDGYVLDELLDVGVLLKELRIADVEDDECSRREVAGVGRVRAVLAGPAFVGRRGQVHLGQVVLAVHPVRGPALRDPLIISFRKFA